MRQVSGPFTLAACLFFFFIGRYSQPTPSYFQNTTHSSRKVLQSTTEFISLVEEPAGPAHLTQLVEKSGLLETKPPVTPGKSGSTEYTVAPFQVLSWYPRIVLYPNFIDAARCEHMINMAKDVVTPSRIQWNATHEVESIERTSSGTFVRTEDDAAGVLSWLDERIAAISLLPVENMEDYNILRYKQHQYCEPHLDAFDPKEFGTLDTQRVATALLILKAPEEGGETVFKLEGERQKDRQDGRSLSAEEWRNCSAGDFMYKPRQGDALLFWSVTPSGQLDQQALHSGCPVKAGEKWVATKWLRNGSVKNLTH